MRETTVGSVDSHAYYILGRADLPTLSNTLGLDTSSQRRFLGPAKD